jgi:CheY-like chemotaxis protein
MPSKPGEILVLDDEENYAEMLQGLLQQNDFVVDMATKPEEALESLEEKNYQLVISDYKMPIMDGAVFLKKAREIYPDLPFILVSGLMNTPELVKVANMGVTLVLEKPLDTDLFIEQVRRFVAPASEAMEEARGNGTEGDLKNTGPRRAVRRLFSYPEHIAYLSELSEPARSLIEDLWTVQEKQFFLFLAHPPGGETDLVMQELSRWKGADEKPVLECRAKELIDPTVIGQVSQSIEDGTSAPVIVVEGLADVSKSEQQEIFQAVHNKEKAARELFVFLLPDELEADALHPDLEAAQRGHRVTVPPLYNRPGDIAEYSLRILEEAASEAGLEELPEIEPEVVHCLLQVAWPGNYLQLERVLHELVKALGTSDSITLSAVEEFLRGEGIEVPGVYETMLQILQSYQRQLIRKEAEEGERGLAEVLEMLNITTEGEAPEDRLRHLPLVYPDLIRPSRPGTHADL